MMHGDRQEQFLERPLPSADDAERAILGSILLDQGLITHVVETLETNDFYSPLHRQVFGAMRSLFDSSTSINAVTISEELKKEGSIESFGGIATIANLTYGLPHYTNIEEFTKIVRSKSNLRQLVRVCSEITCEALTEESEVDVVFANAQSKMNDLCLQAESGETDEHFVPLRKIIDNEVLGLLYDLRHKQTRKMKTGFGVIDSAIGGGLAPSDVMLVAADTGAGKSAFALQIAYQMTQSGVPTAFLAGEMTNAENVMRLLSQLSGITNLNWLTHITEDEYDILTQWAISIRDSNICFEHRISDLHTLRTYLRSIVRTRKVKVLVIDYIQLFKLEKLDKRKRHERISEASQEVKRLANELGIGIIEVAQFNREGAKSSQAGLHDLEGSGQLEKDASMIFILELSDNEFTEDATKRKYRDAKIRIVKGRNVGQSVVHGRFYGRSVQFDFSEEAGRIRR